MCGKIHTHGPLCQSGESFSFCYDYCQECSLFKILVLCTVWRPVDCRGGPCSGPYSHVSYRWSSFGVIEELLFC